MIILLTGATGMVGRNILEHPGAHGLQMLTPGRAELDLMDRRAVQSYLEENKPELIVHCAGRVGGIQANLKQQSKFLADNSSMGLNLITAAYETGILKLLNLGSSCMYPRNCSGVLTEEQILTGELEPSNEGYAIAKISVARLCQFISREDTRFAYRTFIPCNLFGRFDKYDPQNSHLIAAVIHKIHWAKREGRNAVEIWGDGTARREFMDASDLADCIFSFVHRIEKLPEFMNVGVGRDHSVNEYYQIVAEVIGYTGAFSYDLSKPVGMKQKLVSTSKAQALGWNAKGNVKAAVAKAYDDYLSTAAAQNEF